MASALLDSGRVQTFVAVARQRGFSRAARSLGKTQSSVSQAVSLLESELGVRLFQRSGRQVTLTDSGRLFLPHAERLLEDMVRARAELQSASELRSGELVVGTSDTLACYVLPPVLAAFRRRYPGVDLRLSNRPSPATAEGVSERLLHLGVVSLPLPPGHLLDERGRPRAHLEPLLPQSDLLIGPPGHPLLVRRRVPLRALAGAPLLLLDRSTAGRMFLEQALARLPLRARPVVAMEMSSVEVLKRLTQLGFGLSVVPAWAVAAEVAARQLVARPLDGLPPGRSVGLCLPPVDPLPPATAAFAAIARELLARK